jgi:hypothetical protein
MVQYAVEDRSQHEAGCDDKQKAREDRVRSCKNLSSRGFQLARSAKWRPETSRWRRRSKLVIPGTCIFNGPSSNGGIINHREKPR